MRKRILYMGVSVGFTALLALLLAATIGSAAPATEGATRSGLNSPAASQPASVSARRAISIPFGIAITQELNSLGSRVLVTGHGNCWDDGQMFDLHVRVAQSSTNAFAEGHSIDVCASEEQQWDADARTEGQVRFEEGPARACAQATELGVHGTVDEHSWCKDIILQKPATTAY